MANRDMPNCLRALCREGLAAGVVRGRRLGMAAQIVLEYFGGKNYDDLMLPCLLDFCRRAGRAPLAECVSGTARMQGRVEQHYEEGGRPPLDIRNSWPVYISPHEQAFVNCPVLLCAETYTGFQAVALPPVPAPADSYLIAFFPLTDNDRAFLDNWRRAHDNVDWPLEPFVGPMRVRNLLQNPIEVGDRRVDTIKLARVRYALRHISITGGRRYLMREYAERMYDLRLAELLRAKEGLKTEKFAMQWCREQYQTQRNQQRINFCDVRIAGINMRIAVADQQIREIRQTGGLCREILGDGEI
jgi:hypothetical protein